MQSTNSEYGSPYLVIFHFIVILKHDIFSSHSLILYMEKIYHNKIVFCHESSLVFLFFLTKIS